MTKISMILLLYALICSLFFVANVVAQTFFADNFDNPNESQKKWFPLYGQWEFKDKEYHQLKNDVNCMSVVSDDYWKDEWNDYTFEVRANKISGAEGFLIMFRCMGSMQNRGVAIKPSTPRMEKDKVSLQYWWNLGGWGNTTSKVESWGGIASANHPDIITTNKWYNIKIVNTPNKYTLYLDGKEILSVNDSTQEGRGRIGLATWSTLARFDDVVVYGSKGPSQQTIESRGKLTGTWGRFKSQILMQ